jgi:hypothetical protein
LAQALDLHSEAGIAEPGDVEGLVEQESAVGAKSLDDVPTVAWAERPEALEGDVVEGGARTGSLVEVLPGSCGMKRPAV